LKRLHSDFRFSRVLSADWTDTAAPIRGTRSRIHAWHSPLPLGTSKRRRDGLSLPKNGDGSPKKSKGTPPERSSQPSLEI
jgi:hypothetical protein